MRELWLLRHGKAERYDGIEDYDRSLKKRGKRDVIAIGEWLNANSLLPNVVISSPAIRAISTANIICDVINMEHQHIQQEKRLYDEGLVRVRSVLADCPRTFDKVLLVGHNPELEQLLTFLVSPLHLPDAKKLFPTATLARLALPDDWSQLTQWDAELLSITYPKSLQKEDAEALD